MELLKELNLMAPYSFYRVRVHIRDNNEMKELIYLSKDLPRVRPIRAFIENELNVQVIDVRYTRETRLFAVTETV